MERYTPRKLRPWAITALVLRGLIYLLELWPWALLVALFLSPVAPHLRIQYSYILRGHTKIMTDCDYLGPRGFITYTIGTRCPVIVLLKRRKRN